MVCCCLFWYTTADLTYHCLGWGGYVAVRCHLSSHAYSTVLMRISQPRSTIYYANPLITEAEAATQMASMKTFVTNTLGGTFTLSVEPSYLQWHADMPADLSVVRHCFIIISVQCFDRLSHFLFSACWNSVCYDISPGPCRALRDK